MAGHLCEVASLAWGSLILTFHASSQLRSSSLHRWINASTTTTTTTIH